METSGKGSFRWLRRTAFVLTFLTWPVFLASFFLPAAVQIGSMAGAPLGVQSGWQTFVDTLTLSFEAAWSTSEPLFFLCYLSPLPNGLMLFGPLANLFAKRYAAFFGAALFLSATSALWVCLEAYDGLSIGFYLWIGSMLGMALASFMITGSHFMEDNAEHARLLAEL